MSEARDVKDIVKERYGAAAERAAGGAGSSCCGAKDRLLDASDPITCGHYGEAEAAQIPAQALLASLGCGNPTALAELKPGETVLDLGSGGGIDVLLSARRVGPQGFAFGLDMTEPMLALAEENKARSGLKNVQFLKGEIEHIPLPANSVDVIISNCVINLSGDKDQVLREAFRVLKPGGRFAVSDIVVRGQVPDAIRRSMDLWIGCVAGALSEDEYLAKLRAAGFEQPAIEVTRTYTAEDAKALLANEGEEVQRLAAEVDGKFISGFVRAVKPAASVSATPQGRAATRSGSCCGPGCGCS